MNTGTSPHRNIHPSIANKVNVTQLTHSCTSPCHPTGSSRQRLFHFPLFFKWWTNMTGALKHRYLQQLTQNYWSVRSSIQIFTNPSLCLPIKMPIHSSSLIANHLHSPTVSIHPSIISNAYSTISPSIHLPGGQHLYEDGQPATQRPKKKKERKRECEYKVKRGLRQREFGVFLWEIYRQ